MRPVDGGYGQEEEGKGEVHPKVSFDDDGAAATVPDAVVGSQANTLNDLILSNPTQLPPGAAKSTAL